MTHGGSHELTAAQQRQRTEREARNDQARRRGIHLLPSPSEPLAVARQFVADLATHADGPTLRRWRGGWWAWQGPCWQERDAAAMRGALYRYTEHAVCVGGLPGMLVRWNPTRRKIDDVLDALCAVCHLGREVDQPCWLDRRPSGVIVACTNGLLDVERRELLPHTPAFFNLVSAPLDYEPRARVPREWRRFLVALWPRDPQSRKALAEWCGYLVAGRTDLQKILLTVGPTRAGKGVIARLMRALVGARNTCGPTLSSLAGEFGLAPLLGKALAVISDARLTGQHGSVVVERLLSISGEDTLTVNIKYKEQWNGRLTARLVVMSNELPAFGDASSAIVGRFVVLLLSQSWLGHEDNELESRLHKQLPGILNWAFMGLAKLERAGRFIEPPSSREAIVALAEMASPVRMYIGERCVLGPNCEVAVELLYRSYRAWAADNGHPVIAKSVFGRDLRAAFPQLRVGRPWGGGHSRVYRGVGLRESYE